MADLEKLIKDGVIGATVGAVADITLHGGVPIETAAAIGAFAADAMDIMKDDEQKSQATPREQEHRDTTNDELIKFNAHDNSQSNVSYAGGGGISRTHVFHHNGDAENQPHAPFPRGNGTADFGFSESSHYAERLEYEPFASETATPKSCRTESCGTCKPKKEVPLEVQQSILKYQGKSPSKPCQKHEVDMPTNACYSSGSGGGMCEHHVIYDGSKKSPHCIYPQTRQEVSLASKHTGKPVKTYRDVNRTHLTGIEVKNLQDIAYKTNVRDKESFRQELADHIDPTLSYGENKTLLQEHLSAVTPSNIDMTDSEIKDYEARINTITPAEIEQANDPFLLENLKERAANGDSSASVQIELMDIKRDMASMSAPDPAMSWCSSTPETLEFSKTFAPPTESFDPLAGWEAPMQNTANPQHKPII